MASRKVLFLIALCSLGLAAAVGVVPGGGTTGGLRFSNPCWQKQCHTFATCEVVNGTAVCVCPKNCTNVKVPVCGMNWKTYGSLCSLMAESCAMNDWNALRYNGECKAGDCRNSIWHNKLNCPFYSKCQLRHGFPGCVCPTEECPTTYEPLCATDGRTYPNMCHMRQAACRKRKLLRVRNQGHCKPDPCRLHECCCGAVCRVNETNYASCACDFKCSQQFSPVCGSDGKTYNNPCDLRANACRDQNMKLMLASNGACLGAIKDLGLKATDPCAHQTCSHHARCVVDRGFAQCVCPVCPVAKAPVCGSNGVTYDNECLLKRASCVTLVTITKVRNGSCGVDPVPPTTNPCVLRQCGHYSTCVVVRGQPTCICPQLCPEVRAQICGSDGVTYENDCELRRASCKNQKTIVFNHRGPCSVNPTTEPVKPTVDACFDQSCTYHAECIVERGLPKCVCPSNCPNVSTPICASDGKTYDNECGMRRASCIKQLVITVVSAGRCVSPCDTVKCCCGSVCKIRNETATCECDFGCTTQYDPVCGSDRKTYDNECTLRLTACRDRNADLKLASRGSCPIVRPTVDPCAAGLCAFHARCVAVQGQATCVCPEACPLVYSPICGSDGLTYQNDCAMKRASCLRQMSIRIMNNGPCVLVPTQAPTTATPSDSCITKQCEHHSTCEIVAGVAKCVCPKTCEGGIPMVVCGSDGKTYLNECELQNTSCMAGRNIFIVRIGVCLRTQAPTTLPPTTARAVVPTVSPTIDLCALGKCANYAVCEMHQGQPRCVCPRACTDPISPVCGSDRRTYDSMCELRRESCTSGRTISVAKPGSCEPLGRCPTPQLCANQCNPSQDICPRSGKICCCRGCGFICKTPEWSFGRYVCPADPQGCRNDNDCAGGMICCDTGCTKRCIAPRL